MSLMGQTLSALRKIVLIDERITVLNTQLQALTEKVADMDRRLARLEGKMELLESVGSRTRRLPSR